MMRFTTKSKTLLIKAGAVAFWLVAWQLYSDYLGQAILMVSPATVVKTLFSLMGTPVFWRSVGGSCGRILAGFSAAVAAGVVLAVAGHKIGLVKALLDPIMVVMKSIPVASFVLVLLFYVSAKNLAVPATFIMVLPIIYTNLLKGIEETDRQLIEMATVFRVPPLRRLTYIYISQVLPFFVSACSVSLGLAWKSGIAAEVIGVPAGSIGERLYRAKTYLQTGDLFAWTLVIVLISLAFEYLFMFLLRRLLKWVGER